MADNNIWQQILQFILSLIQDKTQASPAQAPVAAPAPAPETIAVNWDDPECHISKRFKVKEATELPSWGCLHIPTEEQKQNILSIAKTLDEMLDEIATIIGSEVHAKIHAWIRPVVSNCPGNEHNGKDYNRYIYETQVWKGLSEQEMAAKHVPNSPHHDGHAVDYHVIGYEGPDKCMEIRQIIDSHDLLAKYNLRMEKINGGWIHNDDLPVGNARWFIP